jgi:uncharacterized damage-inducible protein DinB
MRYTREMMRTVLSLLSVSILSTAAFAAKAPSLGQTLDGQFRNAEREIVGLVQAMPADRINFTPNSLEIKGSEFKGVRTFAQESKHLATYIYMLSSMILGEKPPVDIGKGDAGPDSVQTKDQIVDYMKGAFAFGHKALRSITEENEMDEVPASGPGRKMPRVAAASFMMYHSFDHYGQMVVYLRMNGVVPPASQPRSR